MVGTGTADGSAIEPDAAGEHVFGFVLLNDWSARDIQAFEYQPLGPFLAKSFATTISPWVVTLDALEPYLVEPPVQDPPPAAHLAANRPWGLDLHLEVEPVRDDGEPHVVRPPCTGRSPSSWPTPRRTAPRRDRATSWAAARSADRTPGPRAA